MPKNFKTQSVKDATGVGASGKGKAVVRKQLPGGKTSGLGGGKGESKPESK